MERKEPVVEGRGEGKEGKRQGRGAGKRDVCKGRRSVIECKEQRRRKKRGESKGGKRVG